MTVKSLFFCMSICEQILRNRLVTSRHCYFRRCGNYRPNTYFLRNGNFHPNKCLSRSVNCHPNTYCCFAKKMRYCCVSFHRNTCYSSDCYCPYRSSLTNEKNVRSRIRLNYAVPLPRTYAELS